jgi:hypothetical protein
MFTSKPPKIIFSTFIGLLISSNSVSATHYGGSPSFKKGSIRESRGSGIFSTTKHSSSSSSSTRNHRYDPYANFLRLHYEEIQEQVAQGGGPHVEVIAKFNNCPDLMRSETNLALSTNYRKLFEARRNPDALERAIREVIQENDELRNNCEISKNII